MPIVHVAVPSGTAIMWLWAHVCVMPLTVAQDATAPLGTLFIDMVHAVLLTLATVKATLALTPPLVKCILVVLLLGHVSNGGIVDEGGTNSMMITPCRSLSVAIVGMVVVMSLIMGLYGVINMATIVCGG
jgi:hypothetical protein